MTKVFTPKTEQLTPNIANSIGKEASIDISILPPFPVVENVQAGLQDVLRTVCLSVVLGAAFVARPLGTQVLCQNKLLVTATAAHLSGRGVVGDFHEGAVGPG